MLIPCHLSACLQWCSIGRDGHVPGGGLLYSQTSLVCFCRSRWPYVCLQTLTGTSCSKLRETRRPFWWWQCRGVGHVGRLLRMWQVHWRASDIETRSCSITSFCIWMSMAECFSTTVPTYMLDVNSFCSANDVWTGPWSARLLNLYPIQTSTGCTTSLCAPEESPNPDTSATFYGTAEWVATHSAFCATFHWFHVSPLSCHLDALWSQPILTFCQHLRPTYTCIHVSGGFPEMVFWTCTG